jgi:hypothetical protein
MMGPSSGLLVRIKLNLDPSFPLMGQIETITALCDGLQRVVIVIHATKSAAMPLGAAEENGR